MKKKKTKKQGSKNKLKFPSAVSVEVPNSEQQIEVPKENLIKITLKSVGRVFKSEGKTFEEAINKIKISGGARSTSVIKVEKDGKEIVKILNARHTNGLFGQGSPTMKAIHLKGVRAILGV